MAKKKEEKKICKVCGNPAEAYFNISFKAVPICEGCANQITMQQVKDLIFKAKGE